jgi:hypothetical protein
MSWRRVDASLGPSQRNRHSGTADEFLTATHTDVGLGVILLQVHVNGVGNREVGSGEGLARTVLLGCAKDTCIPGWLGCALGQSGQRMLHVKVGAVVRRIDAREERTK